MGMHLGPIFGLNPTFLMQNHRGMEKNSSFQRRVEVVSLLLLPFIVGSYLGEWGYLFDLLSSFKLQLFLGAICAILMNLMAKNLWSIIWLTVATFFLGADVFVWHTPYSRGGYGERPLKIYLANIHSQNLKWVSPTTQF